MTQKFLPAPSRRGILVAGSAFLLVGCSNVIGPGEPPQLYLLKPTGGASTAGPKVRWQLTVTTPAATDLVDTSRIALVQNDTTVDYYANASWTDRVPALVRAALVEAFETSGRIDAVSAEGEGFHADYVLQTEIRDFAAHYAQPDGIPTIMVRMAAKIAPARGRDITADEIFKHEVTATQNSVEAAVVAFDAALGAVLADIVNWTLGLKLVDRPKV